MTHPSPLGERERQPNIEKQIGKNGNAAADAYRNSPILSHNHLQAKTDKEQIAQKESESVQQKGIGEEEGKSPDDIPEIYSFEKWDSMTGNFPSFLFKTKHEGQQGND